MADHPTKNELSGFVLGMLPPESTDEVAEHLEKCPPCQETVCELDAYKDTLLSGLQKPVPPMDEACRKFVEKAKAIPTEKPAEKLADEPVRVEPELPVFGEYVVLEKIGAGGMGQVFKARHRRMDRIVALKVLAKAAVGSPDAVKRFQREVKAAAKLIHPNIVIAHDAGEQDGTHFLVMEYVAGSDLSAIVKRDGPLTLDKVIDYVRQAACGLAFAHGEGVVHRDIKPANLLVDQKGIVRILDMGLARLDGDLASKAAGEGLTQTGAVMGTVDYMAPEQALDTSTADAKADVYGLGCTLYRLLTGKNVFAGDTLIQKILAHREQPIPTLAAARPEVPPPLDALYRRMVAKEPADRPTMAEIVMELETLQRSEVRGQESGTFSRSGLAPLAPVLRGEGPGVRGSIRKPPRRVMIAAAAAGFLFVCLGVWIIIRDQDGNELARIKGPDGAAVSIEREGAKPVAAPSAASLPQSVATATPTKVVAPKPLPASEPVARPPLDLTAPLWSPPVDADGRMLLPPGRGADDGLIPRPAFVPGLGMWRVETAVPAVQIEALSLSPDGRHAAVAIYSRIRVYDRKSWRPVATFSTNAFDAIAWSPDGKWLAHSGAYYHALEIRNTADFSRSWSLKLPNAAHVLAWHPRSEWLAVGYEKDAGVQLWAPDGTPGPVFKGHTGLSFGITGIAWSADGTQLVSSHWQDSTVRIWNVDGSAGPEFKVKSGGQKVAWSRQGVIATTNGSDREIRFWQGDGTPGAVVKIDNFESRNLAWNPRGDVVAATQGGGIIRFFRADGSQARDPVLIQSGKQSLRVTWDADGESLLVDGSIGLAVVQADGAVTRPIGKLPAFRAVGWNRQGTRLVAADDLGHLRMWNQDGKIVRAWRPDQQVPSTVGWSPTGAHFVVGYEKGALRLFDGEGNEGPVWQGHTLSIGSVTWRADGEQFATGGDDAAVRVWNLEGKLVQKLSGHKTAVKTVDWSEAGPLVSVDDGPGVVSFNDPQPGTVISWDLATGLGTTWCEAEVIAWSFDGRRLTTILPDGTLNHYDTAGKLQRTSKTRSGINLLQGTSDDRLICRFFEKDYTMSSSGREEWEFPIHLGKRPAFHSSGRGHVAVRTDKRVIVLDGGSGEILWVATSLDEGKSSTFTAGGQIIDCDGDSDRELIYFVEHKDTGRYDPRTPAEFQKLVTDAYAADAAARKSRPDDPQRRAAERFLTLGGTLRINKATTDVKGPEQLPAEKFTVTTLKLNDAQIGAYDWARLADLPGLQSLDLGGSTNGDVIARNLTKLTALTSLTLGPGLTDDGLAAVENLPELTAIQLAAPQLTDAGLAHLQHVKGLRTLSLTDADQVSDDGLAHLRGLPVLTALTLTNAPITDAGLAHLRDLPVLTTLSLTESPISDAGLEHLARLHLKSLTLKGAKITDAGAAQLAAQTTLTTLNLSGTSLGDAGLMQLATLRELTKLDVTNTQITRAGLEKFQAAVGRKITLSANPKE